MQHTVKQPITKGVARVPVVMQLEALECGAACLTMILAYYGKWIPLEQVRHDCGVSRDGSNAVNIMKAARFYDLNATGYRYESTESLEKDGSFPCIVHWNFNHFIVLDGFKNGKAYINDPANGSCTLTKEKFDEGFTGVVLQFAPNESFTASGKKKSMLNYAKKRLKGTGPAVAFTVLTGIIAAIMEMISPVFSRFFIDRLITYKNSDLLIPFIIALAAFNFIQILVSAIKNIYSRRINGKMAAVGNSTYMWKVLKLPMNFFSQRMAGDIYMRQASNATISSTLVETVAPLVLNACMTVFYIVVMLRYSVLLTLIGLATIAIDMVVSMLMSKKRVSITRVAERDSAKLASATVSGINMIETIKSSGAEEGYFKKWSGYQASVNSQNVKYANLNQYLGAIPPLVSTLANSFILIVGVYLTMNSKFTTGMVMAFQSFLASFMSPAQTFISAGQTITEMRTQMERVEDVMEYKEEKIFAESDADLSDKLKGNLEIRNVVFGYSPLAKPVIKDFSMLLTTGKTVAIVGGSGSGKSTMSKLISGLYKPWSGEILFDGKPLSAIDKDIFRSSVAVVDQNIILFEDTIENNIKMWDDSIEDFEMVLAARDAQIHYDILKKPGGYQHKIIEGGRNFSGGQRQRLEIARVLAQDPTIIILDEATSALDAKTEYELVKAVRDRGITCIVIAHRLSTIRSCDEIIVLDEGNIVSRGTHDELMQTSEKYRALVTAE